MPHPVPGEYLKYTKDDKKMVAILRGVWHTTVENINGGRFTNSEELNEDPEGLTDTIDKDLDAFSWFNTGVYRA